MSDRRRQGILKEAQVASLYGEETFRDIIAQSRTMPLPTPLGFGCGYAAKGDWLPARRELEAYVAQPKPIQRLLSGPYAWHSSLRDLKEMVAEQRRRIAPYLYLADPGFMMGGFSSLSALINESTVNAKRDSNNWFFKNSNTTAAGAAYWLWLFSGYPSAGAIPAASVAATAPTASTAGAFGQGNAPSSNTKHLVSATAISTVAAGALLVADMTLIVQPILATTTQQTITGSPSRYQSNGNNGVLPFFFQGSAANGSTPNLSLTYTESTAGTTGHTSLSAVAAQASAVAFRTNFATGNIFAPLAAGDVGVRRIESTTWSAAMTTACAWGLAYPYCWIPLGVANTIFGTDLLNTQFNLVQVIDGACITFFMMAGTTSSGVIQGELVLVSGNS